MPNHARSVRFADRIVIPAVDIIGRLQTDLKDLTVSLPQLEEVVRQITDMFLVWHGDWTQLEHYPEMNRIAIPEVMDTSMPAYGKLRMAQHAFAYRYFNRLCESGVFLDNRSGEGVHYVFDAFLGQDIVLFHLRF